jgi:hypothetical protein
MIAQARRNKPEELERMAPGIADDRCACAWELVNDEVTRKAASDQRT